jgi:N-acetyl-gamma-glutamyl-phosphate reductase
MSKPVVFIDGEHGTTGLQIRDRLKGREDLELASIPTERRRDEALRRTLLNEADLAVLCLPDEAARQAVAMIANPRTRVLDGSTAHRVSADWVYGFPELARGQPEAIRTARFVSVPGCYATATVALLRPLVDADLVPRDHPISVHGVQGYSGGGRQLVDAMEGHGGKHHLAGPYRAYALQLTHKHQPEMQYYSGLARKPLFTPAVGSWRQGQLVQVPLHLWNLPQRPTASNLYAVLAAHYEGQYFVRVTPFVSDQPPDATMLGPEVLAGTNFMELFVFENRADGHALLVARLDNLGKGASGAAAQNLDIMLGLERGRSYELQAENDKPVKPFLPPSV